MKIKPMHYNSEKIPNADVMRVTKAPGADKGFLLFHQEDLLLAGPVSQGITRPSSLCKSTNVRLKESH
jgi:hypothetical protein